MPAHVSSLAFPMTASLTDSDPVAEARTTIDDLERGFAAVPLSNAVNQIDHWHRVLAASERTDLNAIADGLGELKACLLGPGLHGDAIGTLLARLGAQTVAASEGAEHEEVGRAVERLGNLLLHAGHALRGPRAEG